MNHVVLARKYRPRSFDQMVGQEHVVQALGNALTSGRLHHAYLFTGTRGIGKTTVSRILAKSLNCTGPDGQGGVTARPCGQCLACTEIDADRYIDYIELDAASNRSIDEIRDLIERAAYKPSVGRYKVFMIDEAHQLTKDAFNALLKTLEEPPEYLKFVLATTDPEKMLPTVLSRCLQFNLRPMPPEVVHAHLQAVLEAEHVPADAGSLRLLSRAARGSMRDALSLTDQAIAYGAGKLDEAGVRSMLGSVDRRHAARLVQALAERDGAAVLATVNELRSLGLSAAGTLEEMAGLLQQMAVEQAVPGALDENDPDVAEAQRLASLMPADETQLLYSIVLHGRGELSLVSDDYAALTMVLLRLLAFPPAGPAPVPAPRAAPLQVTPREARLSTAPRPAVAPPPKALPAAARPPAPAATPAPRSAPDVARAVAPRDDEPPPWVDDALPEVDADAAPMPAFDEPPPSSPKPAAPALVTTALGDRWAALLQPVLASGAIGALVRELAWQAELVGVEAQADGAQLWRLSVERDSLRTPALRDKLQAALVAAGAAGLRLELEPGVAADSMARRDAAEREAAQRAAEQLIQGDPAVRALMSQFRTARIVPGSIKPVSEPRTPS
ncbi:DNA polymerase III subunit gamma/tau [Aquabacterium sp.]|uniref:DNA polymerase III subunit gamma/tau n=1 Tax=Aquabacterium sp. TaxID=1872578 RepID=UPI003784E751